MSSQMELDGRSQSFSQGKGGLMIGGAGYSKFRAVSDMTSCWRCLFDHVPVIIKNSKHYVPVCVE